MDSVKGQFFFKKSGSGLTGQARPDYMRVVLQKQETKRGIGSKWAQPVQARSVASRPILQSILLFYYYHYLLFFLSLLSLSFVMVFFNECRYRFSQFFFNENEDTILLPSSGAVYSEKEFSRELQGKKFVTSEILRLYLQPVPSPDKAVGLCQALTANVELCRIY